MTRDEAIDLLQVMLLDERDPPKLRPESFVSVLRPALLERDISERLAAARFRKAPLFILNPERARRRSAPSNANRTSAA